MPETRLYRGVGGCPRPLRLRARWGGRAFVGIKVGSLFIHLAAVQLPDQAAEDIQAGYQFNTRYFKILYYTGSAIPCRNPPHNGEIA